MPYDKEKCDERHDDIKEKHNKQDAELSKLHGRIDGVYRLLLTAAGALLMAIIAAWLSGKVKI